MKLSMLRIALDSLTWDNLSLRLWSFNREESILSIHLHFYAIKEIFSKVTLHENYWCDLLKKNAKNITKLLITCQIKVQKNLQTWIACKKSQKREQRKNQRSRRHDNTIRTGNRDRRHQCCWKERSNGKKILQWNKMKRHLELPRWIMLRKN